ncbi:MAG: FAD binding domain-containing protein [Sandaracinaceae bacterium]
MQTFNYHRPSSVADAVAALKAAEEGKLLGGGQSLIPVLKLDMAAPTDVISLADIAELKEIKQEGDTLVVGAAATHADVSASDVVRGHTPALAELAGAIGDPQVRHRGTLGGSVAHAAPAADYPAALIGLKATVQTDRRTIAADDFFQGLFETALEEDELIVAVHFPKAERSAYAKLASPASKYAVVGVMVAKHADGVRVAVTGASPRVFRVEAMEAALNASFAPEALDGITVDSEPLNSDLDGTAAYRAHMVGVMARRAVASASAVSG